VFSKSYGRTFDLFSDKKQFLFYLMNVVLEEFIIFSVSLQALLKVLKVFE